MTIKEFFDFVTDPTVKETNMDEYLDKVMEIACNRVITETEKVEDAVFKNSYIPYTMDEVVDIERDFRRAKQGEVPIYATLHGLKADMSTPRLVPELLDENGNVDANIKTVQCLDKLKIDEAEKKEEQDDENDKDENSYEESEDESDEESKDESGEESDDGSGGETAEKKMNTSIHVRPRDESPNSRRVSLMYFWNKK